MSEQGQMSCKIVHLVESLMLLRFPTRSMLSSESIKRCHRTSIFLEKDPTIVNQAQESLNLHCISRYGPIPNMMKTNGIYFPTQELNFSGRPNISLV